MDQFRKLGKQSARRDPRTLRLSAYTSGLALPPASFDLTSKMSNLGEMKNDQLGDCTCAAIGHLIQYWTAANGKQVILSDDEIVSLYSAVGGYVPGQPSTDNGAVEMDVLNYWRKNPICGNSLYAFAYLDSKVIKEAKEAIYYFGGAYLGFNLPLSAQDQDIWDVPFFGTIGKGKPGGWGGHAVPAVAYDSKYIYIITWGAIKKVTWPFYTTYCDETYALLAQDWVMNALSPSGFALNALTEDLQMIA